MIIHASFVVHFDDLIFFFGFAHVPHQQVVNVSDVGVFLLAVETPNISIFIGTIDDPFIGISDPFKGGYNRKTGIELATIFGVSGSNSAQGDDDDGDNGGDGFTSFLSFVVSLSTVLL